MEVTTMELFILNREIIRFDIHSVFGLFEMGIK